MYEYVKDYLPEDDRGNEEIQMWLKSKRAGNLKIWNS